MTIEQGGIGRDRGPPEMDLIVGTLMRHVALIVGAPFLGALMSVVFLSTVPEEWEASALIRLGKIGRLVGTQPGGVVVDSTLVEPAVGVVELLRRGAYREAVIQGDEEGGGEQPRQAKVDLSSLRVSIINDSVGLIDIKMRGYSPEEARLNIEAVVRGLTAQHSALSESSHNLLADQLLRVEEAVRRLERERATQHERLSAAELRCEELGESVSPIFLMGAHDEVIQNLRMQEGLIRGALDSLRRSQTSIIAPIHVTDAPIYPKKAPTIFLAAAVGLFVAISAALYLESGSRATKHAL